MANHQVDLRHVRDNLWHESISAPKTYVALDGAQGVVACATCHGAKGEGMAAAGFPYLAGQGAAYLML